jgi:hypothetical protein
MRSCSFSTARPDSAFRPERQSQSRPGKSPVATLAEIGVEPDGAAGSTFESVSNLKCTIDPNEVKQKAGGGGAECQYAPAN